MQEFLIKQYILRMTEKDIEDFAFKQGITLKKHETELIYNHIKKNHLTLLHGNPKPILDDIKNKVEPLTYNKIEELYVKFKDYIN